jgi:hypothetical protein
MTNPPLEAMRDLVQVDVNNRGLHANADTNLINAWPNDYALACRDLAQTPNAVVGIVTGFYIPDARPPSGETDGPLGAVFLARALTPLGIRVVLAAENWCAPALRAGLQACGLQESVRLVVLPTAEEIGYEPEVKNLEEHLDQRSVVRGLLTDRLGPLTHLIALEKAGPNHNAFSLLLQQRRPATTIDVLRLYLSEESLAHEIIASQARTAPDKQLQGLFNLFFHEVPSHRQTRCYTMKGIDITANTSPAHVLFKGHRTTPAFTTIGIGDGGNEIGMGKIPWEVIRRNVANGSLVACQTESDYLIVSGVSNWGAYALAAGVRHLLRAAPDRELFDPDRERELLQIMVEEGPLVDGLTGQRTVTVDGLPFGEYARPLRQLGNLCDCS